MALALYGFVERRRRIERAGISYEFSVVKDRLALGLSTLPVLRLKEVKLADDEAEELLSDWMDPEDGKYKRYIARLDPNDAKDQDHYKVLGLSKLRYQSTQAQIRTAYRHKVLIYHPDKGKADETELRNEAVFACIQKAYEQLGLSEEKRRAFDSVDPKFDEDIPDGLDPGQDFFRVLGPVFERNARFSINQPVPLLGDEKSDRISVEHFYDFWFDWKSWREFSYLDAEDKTRGEDRYERREIEKQNKIEREKRRKRDLKRVSALVELAYSKDPRVARFKEEDRRAKAQAKEHKRMERQRREQAEKEEQRQRDEAVEEERRQREAEDKKAAQLRQQKKKVLAAQRRRLRELAAATNYWAGESPADNARQQQPLAIMEQIERVCLAAEFEELNSVCEQLSAISVGEEALRLLRECARKEEPAAAATNGAAATKNGNTKDSSSSRPAGIWSNAELQLLVKAVNLYPPGTQQRWMQVAEYVSYHGGEQRTERDVIKQVKLLKSDTMSTSSSAAQLKDAHQKSEEINAAPAVGAQKSEAINRSAAEVPAAATMTAPAATNAASTTAAAGDDEWDAEQQRQLEKALKATPATDPERWEKIAAQVEGKTKKQCVRRYKRLAELVKQAKAGGETAQ